MSVAGNADTPDPADLRVSYHHGDLTETAMAAEPMEQFARWFADAAAQRHLLPEPNAMVLATASPDGRPRARTVLLKAFDARGLCFYTNYESAKGRQLESNPRACLCFAWHPIQRQVIVEGTVERLTRAESEAYFRSRPHGSQLGAWASQRQSSVIGSRAELDARFQALVDRFPEGAAVPLPDFWGGYRVLPEIVEFWQGRQDRMHDRLRYRLAGQAWLLERLLP